MMSSTRQQSAPIISLRSIGVGIIGIIFICVTAIPALPDSSIEIEVNQKSQWKLQPAQAGELSIDQYCLLQGFKESLSVDSLSFYKLDKQYFNIKLRSASVDALKKQCSNVKIEPNGYLFVSDVENILVSEQKKSIVKTVFSNPNLVAAFAALGSAIIGLVTYHRQKNIDREFKKMEIKRAAVTEYLCSIESLINHAAYKNKEDEDFDEANKILQCKEELNKIYICASNSI